MAPAVKRPTAVKVGHLRFTVGYLKEDEWSKHPDTEDKDSGQMFGVKQQILVRMVDGQAEDNTREVLLHEITHACFFAAGLYAENHHQYEDIEETFIMRTAPLMLQVLRDNPKVLAYLTG